MNPKKNSIEHLKLLAKRANCAITVLNDDHIQIKGYLLVNWYPSSKNKTAYVAGTKRGVFNVGAAKAIKMANTQPPLQKSTPRKNHKKKRLRLLKTNPYCHWCKKMLNEETATLEHIIPRSRGGLDNSNNYKLACFRCNNNRDNQMTEIKNE